MYKITFVCTGNTCRSPMAEGIFRVLAKELGLQDVECSSCGTSAYDGMLVTSYAVQAAKQYGANISAHRARELTDKLAAETDLFICMTKSHAEDLRDWYHIPDEQIAVLGAGITDPYGGSQEEYDRCAKAIYDALKAWIEKRLEDKA